MDDKSLSGMKRRRIVTVVLAAILLVLAILYCVLRVDPEERELEKLKTALIANRHEQRYFMDPLGRSRSGTKNGLRDGGGNAAKDSAESQGDGRESGLGDYGSREEIRDAISQLSPETRKRLARLVMRERLREAREKTAHLSDDKKREIVDKMIHDVRKRFADMPDEKRQEAKEHLNSEEGQEKMKEAFDFYFNEFSAKEREMLDPLVQEILVNIDAL